MHARRKLRDIYTRLISARRGRLLTIGALLSNTRSSIAKVTDAPELIYLLRRHDVVIPIRMLCSTNHKDMTGKRTAVDATNSVRFSSAPNHRMQRRTWLGPYHSTGRAGVASMTKTHGLIKESYISIKAEHNVGWNALLL